MGYIHCCSGLRACRTFRVKPKGDSVYCEIDYLEICPVCGHTILILTKKGFDGKITVYKLKNKKAHLFFEKIQNDICAEITATSNYYTNYQGKFYLNYNEYGNKKKCYSNLSSMKLGKF